MKPRWVILTAIGYNWENVHLDDKGKPVTYATEREAKEELADLLATTKEAAKRGDLAEAYRRCDYRIRKEGETE